MKMFSAAVATLLLSGSLLASSYYPARIDDAKAIYLTNKSFPVQGDGVADDSDAIQQAINKVQETTNQGILFVPAAGPTRWRAAPAATLYSAILRELQTKGNDARFKKTERGKFAVGKAS